MDNLSSKCSLWTLISFFPANVRPGRMRGTEMFDPLFTMRRSPPARVSSETGGKTSASMSTPGVAPVTDRKTRMCWRFS